MPLKKELSYLDLIILGIAGAVGTGALFSTAGMTADAGPSAVISWILGGVFYLFIGLTYSEISMNLPEAGGPSRYSLYSHGKLTNLINAMADLVWYLFIPPIEALAVVEGLTFFFPSLLTPAGTPTLIGGLVGVILLILFIPFNYFGVKAFGRSTTSFGAVKLVLYVALALGVMGVFFSARNFVSYGGLAPFGLAGMFTAIPLAMFAFGGIRVIPDYAEEARDRRRLSSAIILTVIGQTLIYVLFAIAFVGGVNWSKVALSPGNWTGVTSALPGNPFVDLSQSNSALLILALIVALIGPFVTGYIYLGAGTRVLFAMGRTGIVTKLMKQLHSTYSIPVWALLVFGIVGAVITFLTSPIPTIYSLISDAVVAGYLGFAVNPVAMMAMRKKYEYKLKGGPIIAALAFVFSSLIAFWSGWPSVPYSVIIIAIAVGIFGAVYRAFENVFNSLWYIAYIAFITLMTYIGSDGALSLINFYLASALVAVISVAVFFPWGIISAKRDIKIPTEQEIENQ
ncbi:MULTISPECIES: APC family permease [Metallosphaera]|uniref:APC family permease n=1 Tax=Metallosphaera TaxID=41980 RepID=UPI001F05EDF4|nr:APC family permease [Metallosphaera sedula]MCH1771227.1 APC family permease [Metallosphaera sedula]MCP6729599.1 APC family permease [Metallosphaera sedula]